MAYSDPATAVAGTVATAAFWNVSGRDNIRALYGGAMAIASQASNDLIYAASATALGRWALTAGQALRKNYANSALEPVYPLVTFNVDHFVQVVSTTTETNLTSGTVPGGTLGNSGTIHFVMTGEIFNNAGAGRTCTIRVKFGGTTVATFAANNGTNANGQPFRLDVCVMSNGGTANQNYHSVFFLAQGGDVAGTENQITSGSGRAYTSAYYGTAHDSTGNLTLAVTAQLSHSEANFYISKRNNTAMVWRGSS